MSECIWKGVTKNGVNCDGPVMDYPAGGKELTPLCEHHRGVAMASEDHISHPAHYAAGRKYEPIEVIADWELGFALGNAVKYISRAGRKGDAVEDLKKARFYLDWEIRRMEKEGSR
jgi:hypothetical protein